MLAFIDFKKRGPQRKRPDDDTLAELYRTKTVKEIADMFDVKPSTVRSWACIIRKAHVSSDMNGGDS